MKKQIKSLLLIALLVGMSAPIWGQASTEGKEFWVGLFNASSPSGFKEKCFDPFIAISAKEACQVTISNPSKNWKLGPINLKADEWRFFRKDEIPLTYWYDVNWSASNASENVTNHGIKIESSKAVSVFAAMRMEFSYDATNVLPTEALRGEYIIQDYPVYNHGDEDAHAIFTIVATEDNTTVDIIPTTQTIKGKPANQLFSVDLNKGQTYQVISTDRQTFSGTQVKAYAKGHPSIPRKIAIFSGADFTDVPGNKSARDCLYEQAMPTEYWGTEFVVTRSLEKDANRIRITASDMAADIEIDGYDVYHLNPFETWEFEISEDLASGDMYKEIVEKAKRQVPMIVNGYAHYIKTSCPCAVFSYDVSSGYKHSANSEVNSSATGDPSMVWISPLQQRISKITFGACGTQNCEEDGHTRRHFVNIVCLTNDTATFKLKSDQRANIPVTFQTVPGNPKYSYGRAFLVDTDEDDDKIYTMSNDLGFIAHVYGNGKNESYAYSVGSATVKQGVNVNGKTFTDGYVNPDSYCIGTDMEFDAQVGTDDITRVDWNFGDGTSEYQGDPATSHIYDVPGWYDVSADLYGRQVCTDEDNQYLGNVHFSFYIARPDTFYSKAHECVAEDYTGPMVEEKVREVGCDSVIYTTTTYTRNTSYEYSVKAEDSYTINGTTYETSQDVKWTLDGANSTGCDSTITCHLRVVTCLDMNIPNDVTNKHICEGDPTIDIPYIYRKGDIGETHFICGTLDTILVPENDIITIPTKDLKAGKYQAMITVQDTICPRIIPFPIDLTVYYQPLSIFAYKFNNVLAIYNNTGYSFTNNYQWYRNGELIPGATGSIYHSDIPFVLNDTYYVMLTRTDGVTMPTCEWTVDHVDDYSDTQQVNAPARKTIIHQNLYIERDGHLYNSYGVRVR